MSMLSGLKDLCRYYVGRSLSIEFVNGWGWTVNTPTACVSYEDIDAVNLTLAEIVPTGFFAYESASTRGFLGRIVTPGHPLYDQPLVAFTMSDGFDYDFTTNVCRTWRFWIGEGELVCSPASFPRVCGPRIIGGYGSVAATKAHL